MTNCHNSVIFDNPVSSIPFYPNTLYFIHKKDKTQIGIKIAFI